MSDRRATAISRPNIALLKYWGTRDDDLNLPLNPSVSLTLDGLTTRTTVVFEHDLKEDSLVLDGGPADEAARARVARHLDHVREDAGADPDLHARVVSENSFPMGAGIALSASAFSALTVAATAALGIKRTRRELSAMARLGSGSASRSLFGGFVEWDEGEDHASSSARQLAPPDHWDLHDVVLVVERGHKRVTSQSGHALARTSPLLQGRLTWVRTVLPTVREAIQARDLATLGPIVERDALAMHGIMMTSTPPLLYWGPGTMRVLRAVHRWREQGVPCWFTIDAGPNVHVLVPGDGVDEVVHRAREELELDDADILAAGPGEGTELVDDHLA